MPKYREFQNDNRSKFRRILSESFKTNTEVNNVRKQIIFRNKIDRVTLLRFR